MEHNIQNPWNYYKNDNRTHTHTHTNSTFISIDGSKKVLFSWITHFSRCQSVHVVFFNCAVLHTWSNLHTRAQYRCSTHLNLNMKQFTSYKWTQEVYSNLKYSWNESRINMSNCRNKILFKTSPASNFLKILAWNSLIFPIRSLREAFKNKKLHILWHLA